MGLDDSQLRTLHELLLQDRGVIISVRRQSIEQLLKIREKEKDALLPKLTPIQQAKLQRVWFEHQQHQLELIDELSELAAQPTP